jgi:hypothetical protein
LRQIHPSYKIKILEMKKIFAFLLAAFVFISCAENLVTGRKQLSLVSEAELQSMAKEEYQTFLTANSVVNANTNKDAEMVRRVGSRIALQLKYIMIVKDKHLSWKDTSGHLTW